MRRQGGILGDLIKGAIAGAVATWTLDRVADAIEGRGELGAAIHDFVTGEDGGDGAGRESGGHRRGRPRGARVSRGRPGAGRQPSGGNPERSPGSPEPSRTTPTKPSRTSPLRWGFAIGAGALYGVVRPRVPLLSRSERMGFGSSFFVLIDEGLLSGLGFRAPPTAFPWNTETRGLAGHIVFGVVADATLSALDRLT